MGEHTKTCRKKVAPSSSDGVTLIELMVALAIGSFLIIGAVTVANQSRQAFRINESIARVQETAQFAMDTIEADLRLASNWGKISRGDAINGRALSESYGDLEDDPDPLNLLSAKAKECGANWALNLLRPIEGSDNSYTLDCPETGKAQADSDVVTIRRASVETALDEGRIQIQSTRTQGQLFDDGSLPSGFASTTSETHNLIVNSYYVAESSELIPGVPTLRRKTLTVLGTEPNIEDQEVAPGVENMQLQFGVDVDQDNTVDRYVNPGSAILDPAEADFIPAARVLTARIWLVVRSVDREIGIADDRTYQPGNAPAVDPDDDYRRLQVSKTILLRNART